MISKADRIDGEGEIKGCLCVRSGINNFFIKDIPVIKSTIKHSHDGGKNFYSSEEINISMEYLSQFPDRFKE